MFIKPFRIKSQTQLKGSERKKLRAELFQAYPSLTSNDLSKLMPNKEDVTLVRMYCYKGESVNVYQVQKDPLFFMVEKEKEIYPTVYLLWKCPDLMHTFTTHAHVIAILAGGADLMLPGIITKGEMNPHSYGKFEKGFPVAVNTTENKVPVAIGITAHSSMDMFMSGRHGKGVSILHVYGDQLWEMGTRSPPPKFGPPDIMLSGEDSLEKEDNIEEVVDFSETHEGEIIDEISRDQVTNALQELDLDDQTPDSLSSLSPEASPPQEETTQPTGPEVMDKLLLHCFLKAWKTSGKKVEVPILTSNFYRLHMIPACPDGASLDIKKSSYKKLSKFLNAMAKNELIQVKEFPKGIENITAVNWAHEDIKSFIVDKEETSIKPEVNKKDNSRTFIPPLIEEVNQVSGETVQFFKANGLSKGDVLSTAEVRSIVTEYIRSKGLQKEGQKTVNLDPLLHEAVVNRKEGYKETLRWDEIFSRVLGKMAPAVRITRHGSVPVIRKGKLEPIDLAVAKRSGNKKVTLVYNASIYGIDEAEFAHQIQVGVAASTSVGPAEHKPQGTTQVLIQGNQVAFVGKLLLETYHLPRKYIRGLELAGKSKK
ncbi:eukaryotic translation initiation factor 2D-like [Homarus americanus]|uniref:eukaryotic translation initiation factor 2D-like n=1 Tax=Homarus americanus TaxID=6706 RepID=UPI001C447BCA|nr:eukaryotic translation initiation factor 2D-like [Homarus americanus]XP_042235585.1 eukaryotic translation initiation factor 2D-like [Homarus americanus]XP_042235586.1 eukaryotic translation initiation factor 2D-like [Homarus americanus]